MKKRAMVFDSLRDSNLLLKKENVSLKQRVQELEQAIRSLLNTVNMQ